MCTMNGPELAYEFFCNVKSDLKTKNRFTCDPCVNTMIDRFASEERNIHYIKSGDILYRARIYKEDGAETRYRNPPDEAFKGYDEEKSHVNKTYNSIGDGRCNPAFIPYLYTAKSEACSIHEIRPAMGDYISIAQIRAEEDLKILHLSSPSHWRTYSEDIVPGVSNGLIYIYLAEEFSRPAKEPGAYLLCQYISEYVKHLGFDGLSYHSSVYMAQEETDEETNQQSTNVVIFNHTKCRAINSRLRRINNISISFG